MYHFRNCSTTLLLMPKKNNNNNTPRNKKLKKVNLSLSHSLSLSLSLTQFLFFFIISYCLLRCFNSFDLRMLFFLYLSPLYSLFLLLFQNVPLLLLLLPLIFFAINLFFLNFLKLLILSTYSFRLYSKHVHFFLLFFQPLFLSLLSELPKKLRRNTISLNP
ncbi:unnamed protein product [Acanthosepion pharaonis]|uniref:Transmembrane protein n=1 Tax=Acanthosepion pharaonis TaxID=158019 RepID=A0A812CXJ0_ACAPH|nr:unnamed protein product [Sepia pharaonis]